MPSVSSPGSCVPTPCSPLQPCYSQAPARVRLRPYPGRIPGRPTRYWWRDAGSGPGHAPPVMPPMGREVADRPCEPWWSGSRIPSTRWRWSPRGGGVCQRSAAAIRMPRSSPSFATPARCSGRLPIPPGRSTRPTGAPCRRLLRTFRLWPRCRWGCRELGPVRSGAGLVRRGTGPVRRTPTRLVARFPGRNPGPSGTLRSRFGTTCAVPDQNTPTHPRSPPGARRGRDEPMGRETTTWPS